MTFLENTNKHMDIKAAEAQPNQLFLFKKLTRFLKIDKYETD